MLRRLLCALGIHDYTPWVAHSPPCISGAAVHEARRCQRPGCGGGSFHRRHRFTEHIKETDQP